MSDLHDRTTIVMDPDPFNADKPWILYDGNTRVGNYATHKEADDKACELYSSKASDDSQDS